MTAIHHRITEKKTDLAGLITRLHFDRNPGLLKRYGSAGKERCHEDAVFHLDFLTEALKMEHRGMYANYILWAAAMLENRNIPKSDLLENLEYILLDSEELFDTIEFPVGLHSLAAPDSMDALADLWLKVMENSMEENVAMSLQSEGKKINFTFSGYLLKEKEFEGTGMGLAIVKKIIDNLEGQIRFESELNKGTTFYITLYKNR